MDETFFLGLVYNASLLLAMVLVFEVFAVNLEKGKSVVLQIVGGFVLGAIGLAVMRTNWELIPGVIFDTRSVLLGISGLFFGVIPTIVVTIITAIYRIFLGGSGVYMGVSVIVESALIGLVWRHFRVNSLSKLKWWELYILGLVIHIVMLFLILVLPSSIKIGVFTSIWFPVMMIYPVATLLLGAILQNRLKRDIFSRELAESEDKLRTLNHEILADKQKIEAILRDMGDAVFVTDTNKKITMANKAMELLFGLSENEVKNRSIDEMISLSYESSGEKPFDLINSVFDNKKMARPKESLVLNKKGGNKVFVDGVATPIIDDDKKLIGTVWVFRDVTKEKEIDKMKSDFVSLASHQLRTPLTGIKWFVELLGDNISSLSTEKIQEYVEKIGESNARMISLVNDLVNTSRVDAGKLAKVVERHLVGEVLKEAVEAQGRIFVDKNIKVVGLELIPKDLGVEVDKIQISQVFGNLLNNAASYSPLGSDIKVAAKKNGEKVRVSIQDQGLGIPLSQKEKVFSKFFRGDNVSRHIPGSGLGLYVAKSIVENHGGRIWFESEENVGTTFFVELPLKQGA